VLRVPPTWKRKRAKRSNATMQLRKGQKIIKMDQKNALEDVEHGLNLYNHAALMKSEPESEDKTAISNVRKEANTQTRRAPMRYIVGSWRARCHREATSATNYCLLLRLKQHADNGAVLVASCFEGSLRPAPTSARLPATKKLRNTSRPS